jgi:hypothetical protein
VGCRDAALGFFHYVGEILETNEGKEGEQNCIGNAGQQAPSIGGRVSADAAGTPALKAGNDDDHETAGFDQREQAGGEQHRFENSPAGDRAERNQHEHNDDARLCR